MNQTEREVIVQYQQMIVLLAADQNRLKEAIAAKEKSILEDIDYLRKRAKWRIFFAYPDIWFALRQYKKMVKAYNKRVTVIQSFIQAVNQLREELARDAQFNQNFEHD